MGIYSRWKFTILLVALMVLLAARVATLDLEQGQLVIDLSGAVLLMAAALSLSDRRHFRIGALALGLPIIGLTVAVRGLAGAAARPELELIRAGGALFLAFTIVMIVRALLTQREVTRDTLAGAFCGYLLIGVVWTELYCWIALDSPAAFGGPLIDDNPLAFDRRWQLLQYFSFATLTSVGYGDIVPVSPVARFLACLEAICGQFYLVVLVAGLVGMRASDLAARRDASRR